MRLCDICFTVAYLFCVVLGATSGEGESEKKWTFSSSVDIDPDQFAQDPFANKLRHLPAGQFTMGNTLDPLEEVKAEKQRQPQDNVKINAFSIDAWPASNREFRAFVKATGYKTEAEKFGWSFVLSSELSVDERKKATGHHNSWLAVPRAHWRNPLGLDASNTFLSKLDHAAVHISWNDAKAFCEWRGLRLPTESEWEYAARGGLQQKRYSWGNQKPDENNWRMNFWQGEFPHGNTLEDGWFSTCPSTEYEPNQAGLYNMLGNVWEWTSSEADFKREESPNQVHYILRGGSFIDTIQQNGQTSVIDVNVMSLNTPDAGSSNVGVRCAKSRGARTYKSHGYRYDDVQRTVQELDQNKISQLAAAGKFDELRKYMGRAAHVMRADKAQKHMLKKQDNNEKIQHILGQPFEEPDEDEPELDTRQRIQAEKLERMRRIQLILDTMAMDEEEAQGSSDL